MDSLGKELATYLSIAWLLPLVGFVIEVFNGFVWNRLSKKAAILAVACIATGFVMSGFAFCRWGCETKWQVFAPHESGSAQHSVMDNPHAAPGGHDDAGHKAADQKATKPVVFSGKFYTLAKFGALELSLDYYIDSLTLTMFCMVTFIATCIHIFAIGYMSEELTEEFVDHSAHDSHGHHVHRPGRFYRFFSFMSLFCFAMLGLVIAGNIFQVFVFWELVGICSYLLIGFYTERKSANVAANKAFIVNRVGDFGFIIGLMILWTYCGTFNFDDYKSGEVTKPGLFHMVRGADGEVAFADSKHETVVLKTEQTDAAHGSKWVAPSDETPMRRTIPYLLLVVAGLGVFAGCVGKSAQFPLQTWLPDAMEGPTPVSALVHSATMVAAGVYLAARFFPVFTTEVLLAVAYTGCITLFVAATIAVVATDIKKVLAYSTISQLGYMMLAIGLGGWSAGLFHLITHAFFKSLMFLCSGAVIYGCHHEQEMPKMGGLLKKMPITGFAMLVGVCAIAGFGIPGTPIAFSGFYSKDAIIATALAYTQANPLHFLLFIVPLVTAGITAFYMFRLWFYTFTGTPRDQHVYDHCHEVPKVMFVPLIVLAVLAFGCAWGGEDGVLYQMLLFSQPVGLEHGTMAAGVAQVALPSEHAIHAVHGTAGIVALMSALLGSLAAFLLYCKPVVDPDNIKRQFSGLHGFLVEKWHFDTLYEAMFVRPSHAVGRWAVSFDRIVLDGTLHATAKIMVVVATVDRKFDEGVVDGLVNLVGDVTRSVGFSLSVFQTGRIRQYVMFIAVSVVALFALLFAFLPKA